MQHVILGQDSVVEALLHARRTQRLPHALLFSGPPGVGREATARALATALLCENQETEQALSSFGCGTCGSCHRVAVGTHPDVLWVMPEVEMVRRGLAGGDDKKKPSSEIKVDAIRELARVLRLTPYEGRGRVAIIVDAHRMNANASNALLKTLEEPRPDTCMVLTVPHPRAVLPTIVSRCFRLTFRPLSTEIVEQILRRREIADASERARMSEGSLEKALALDPKAAADAQLRAREFAEQLASGTLGQRMDAAESAGKDRHDVDELLGSVQALLALSLRASILGQSVEASSRSPDDASEIQARLARIEEARRRIQGNAQIQVALEDLLLRSGESV